MALNDVHARLSHQAIPSRTPSAVAAVADRGRLPLGLAQIRNMDWLTFINRKSAFGIAEE
jgi:hypothetical protein